MTMALLATKLALLGCDPQVRSAALHLSGWVPAPMCVLRDLLALHDVVIS
jgi:hypothetical protein